MSGNWIKFFPIRRIRIFLAVGKYDIIASVYRRQHGRAAFCTPTQNIVHVKRSCFSDRIERHDLDADVRVIKEEIRKKKGACGYGKRSDKRRVPGGHHGQRH